MADYNIRWISETESTNTLLACCKSDFEEGGIIAAIHQTAGRGQKGNIWKSAEGQNLTFSILLKPSFLPVQSQASICQAVALGIADYLGSKGTDVRIKWPNDIYVGDRKICGTLIENSISGDCLADCIVGIGLNVNQTDFEGCGPNPTSMRLENGRTYNIGEELPDLAEKILERYHRIGSPHDRNRIESQYTALLYRRGQWHHFEEMPSSEIPTERREGKRFTARILGIDATFRLILEHTDGTVHSYAFKELKYIIGR